MALQPCCTREWASMPLNVFAGIIAGHCAALAPEQETSVVSPFIDLTLYRMIRRQSAAAACVRLADRFFATIVGCAFYRPRSGALAEFDLQPGEPRAVGKWRHLNGLSGRERDLSHCGHGRGAELKIFTAYAFRSSSKNKSGCCSARMAALQNQINPHFLFNTLNSISSLVRF